MLSVDAMIYDGWVLWLLAISSSVADNMQVNEASKTLEANWTGSSSAAIHGDCEMDVILLLSGNTGCAETPDG